ncbi:MAG: alpha/beta hydrolase [Woeseiaceae bacterium]|nr:alpha/beta hydrolase [Woeseiaceae bacterium]
MSSLRAKMMRAVTGAWFRSVNAERADVQRMRTVWHALANTLWTASGVDVRRTEFAGMRSEWLTPQAPARGKAMLYLHGGAYVFGNCTTHRQLVSYVARSCGVRALVIEYRLAPENPFPAAIDDSLAAYRALRDDGYGPGDIVLAGDSAGGGLVMALLLSLRDAGEEMPAGAVLLSPWLDLTASGESMTTRAKRDPWFKPPDMPIIASYYCAEDEYRNPLVSPVFANVEGLPPIYIQVGDDEILLSDSTRIAGNIEAAGGDVTLEVWPDMFHVFQVFVHQMPESRAAIDKLVPFVKSRLGVAVASEA